VAHVLRAVPDLGVALPPTALGKDFSERAVAWTPLQGRAAQVQPRHRAQHVDLDPLDPAEGQAEIAPGTPSR
jgi:hypothetical protein